MSHYQQQLFQNLELKYDLLVIEGNYKEGLRIGRWKIFSRSTPYIEEQGFKGGLHCDYFYKENYDTKDIEIISKDKYSDGILNGPYKVYYYNGNLELEGSYVDGKKDGLWKTYSFQGELKTEEQYKDGKLI